MTLGRLPRLPWDLAVPLDPTFLHDVLGIGLFGFLLALRERGPARQLLLAALAAFVLLTAMSPPTGRFFIEPYLWCAAAAAPVPWRRLKSLFFKALTAQAALVAGAAIYLGGVLFPGALTPTQRDRVMTLMAQGYTEAKWLDATLPPDAVLLGEFRSRALLPRPFVVGDRFVLVLGEIFFFPDVSNWKQHLTAFVKEERVTVLMTRYPIGSPPYAWLATRYGTPLAGPATFRNAGRSPFNRGNSTSWIVTSLNVDGSPSQAKGSSSASNDRQIRHIRRGELDVPTRR